MTKLITPLTLAAFSFVLLLTAQQAHAGAWLKPEGQSEFILSSLYFSSDGFWDRNGNQQAQPRFDKLELNPYLEYGYNDRLTLGGSVFLHSLSQENALGEKDNLGLGNSEWFARTPLWRGEEGILSLQPLIALPSYYEHDGAPRSGSESFDGELSLLYGHNFTLFGDAHYADTRIGYRHRFDGALDDQIRIDAKIGFALAPSWQFIPAAYSTWSLSSAKNPVFTEDGQQDYDLIKLEAMLRYDLSSATYLQGGGFSHVYGRNVGDGQGAMLSIGHHF